MRGKFPQTLIISDGIGRENCIYFSVLCFGAKIDVYFGLNDVVVVIIGVYHHLMNATAFKHLISSPYNSFSVASFLSCRSL